MPYIKRFKSILEPIANNIEPDYAVAVRIPTAITTLEQTIERIGKK